MHKITSASIALALSIFFTNPAVAAAPWAYSGLKGPAHWGQLDPAYSLCVNGRQQSPVDIAATTKAALPEIGFNYRATGNQIENDGHVVEINYKPGSTIVYENTGYELVQSHFHTPAEHTINGKSYAMEVQHVHRSKAGSLLIIAVLFTPGEDNRALHHSWLKLLSEKHTRHLLYKEINPSDLLPSNREYYRLTGSLTKPPCTENVTWLVMKQPATATPKQILELRKTIHADNHRPVQPLNNRTILE